MRAGARDGSRGSLPVAVLFAVLVIAAAGIGGTSHFTGARWYPRLGASKHLSSLTPSKINLKRAPITKSSPHSSATVPSWVLVLVIAVVVLVLAGLLWRWWRNRRAPRAPRLPASALQTSRSVQATPEPEPEALLTGIELALQALDEQREPADAIVRAWLGLQETAEESGIVRRPSETPTEFTTRILSGAFADDRALRTLLRLYLRTRFGDHPVTAEDVAAVREALRRLVATWRAAERTPAAGVR